MFDITNFKTKATKGKYGFTTELVNAFNRWLEDEANKLRKDTKPSTIAKAVYKATCEFWDEVNYRAYPFYDENAKY